MIITFNKYEAQAFRRLAGKVLVHTLSHPQIDFIKAVRETGSGEISVAEWMSLNHLIANIHTITDEEGA